jgi:dinuclear metal center YbgI/SA1388 family protein
VGNGRRRGLGDVSEPGGDVAEIELESLVGFLDRFLGIADFPDYPGALNGLQVEGPRVIRRLAAAVDAGTPTIQAAIEAECDLLLVHHGLFWNAPAPVTGRVYRRLAPLLRREVAVYSAHLPLDAHPEVGNCAVLARALGFDPVDRFGSYEGREIGYRVETDEDRGEMIRRLEGVLGGPVRLLPGGPERIRRLGIVTGGGGSFLSDAAAEGLDTLLTGEAPHHTWMDAMEQGVNVLLGGHYLTETWGVRALAERIEEETGVPWTFLDFPTGL